MKNMFESLGITVIEFSYLLVLPEQTIYAWFNRKNTIPPPHSSYIAALEICHLHKKEEDLQLLSSRGEIENEAATKAEAKKICKALTASLHQNTYKLDKLKQKENRLLHRWYVAENYAQYLPPELQQSENVLAWCGLMRRKSKFELVDVKLAIKKWEQKIVGLRAEIAYWEG